MLNGKAWLREEAIRKKNAKAKSLARLAKLASLKAVAAAYAAENITKTTPAMLAVADQLGELGIFYYQEYPVVIQVKGDFKLYIMDFYLYELNICLEVDGLYHTLEEQREYDALRDRRIACPTIRIPNDAALDPFFNLLDWL